MTSYKKSVYYSSPFNAEIRVNLTVLAADEGVAFTRSLNLDPGPAGCASAAAQLATSSIQRHILELCSCHRLQV